MTRALRLGYRRRMRFCGVLLSLLLVVSGCAEYAEFRSAPPGAKVYLNDQFIGLTPTDYRIPRSQVTEPRTYRIELDGYQTDTGPLRPSVAPGRIVAACFTLCITCAFRGFYYFRRVDAALSRDHPVAASSSSKGTLAERLQKLDEAHDKGVISDDEYRRLRAEILNEF